MSKLCCNGCYYYKSNQGVTILCSNPNNIPYGMGLGKNQFITKFKSDLKTNGCDCYTDEIKYKLNKLEL